MALSESGAGKDDQWVELRVTPFVSDEGSEINRVVARARYYDETGVDEQLAAGERASANLDYSREIPEREKIPDVSPFLIGSLRLEDE